MTTGIIGALGASASMTYTPTQDAKILISIFANGGSGGLSINGTTICALATGTSLSGVAHFVGAGQTVTIATSATTNAVISALEESLS